MVSQQKFKEVDKRLQEANNQLQERDNNAAAANQLFQEIDNQLQEANRRLHEYHNDYVAAEQLFKEADDRLQELDQKYGGLISREDTTRELDRKIAILTNRIEQLDRQAKSDEIDLSVKIESLKAKLKDLEEQEIVEAFGFYESKYNFQEAEDYKQRLDDIRSLQKQLIKEKQAAICHTEWTVAGSVKEGKRMTDNFIKLVLRAFNGESDAAVMKVKYNNVQIMENRVRKAYEDLGSSGFRVKIVSL